MLAYIIRRVALSFLVLFVVSVIVVMSLRLIPGDPARIIAGEHASEEVVRRIRHELGLNESLVVQYARYVYNAFQGDLGESYYYRRPVAKELAIRFPRTLQLAVGGVLVSAIVGTVFGIIAAVHRGSPVDQVVTGVSLIGVCAPSFWLALLLMLLFAVNLRWLPTGGVGSFKHLILPTLTLGIWGAGYIARLTRSTMVDVLSKDYIRVARSKGISENAVRYKHALRNAFIPTVTVVGLQFGGFLAEAVFTETVFAWPGIARLVVTAVMTRDYPILQAAVLYLAVSYSLINIGVDMLYVVLDPRIRYY